MRKDQRFAFSSTREALIPRRTAESLCRDGKPAMFAPGGHGMQNRIGEFLVQIGAMKQFQVDEVLRAQAEGDARMFGEIAIALGYIDDEAIRKYIDYKHAQPGGQ